MMVDTNIPELSEQEIQDFLKLANGSERRRYPKLLHSPGDEFNCVFNFMMQDSYMQPHLHPSEEKIEKIYLVRGKVATLFFDEQGEIKKGIVLENGGVELIEVPAFAWHTYVILTDYAVTYETMMGVYHPDTWKKTSGWAPLENTKDASIYLQRLRSEVNEAQK
jgi:cupin fold WbuC family metalloprotein